MLLFRRLVFASLIIITIFLPWYFCLFFAAPFSKRKLLCTSVESRPAMSMFSQRSADNVPGAGRPKGKACGSRVKTGNRPHDLVCVASNSASYEISSPHRISWVISLGASPTGGDAFDFSSKRSVPYKLAVVVTCAAVVADIWMHYIIIGLATVYASIFYDLASYAFIRPDSAYCSFLRLLLSSLAPPPPPLPRLLHSILVLVAA
jgi:hypothetical protein